MKSRSLLNRFRLFAACAVGGSMLISGCTFRDLNTNLIAGTLAFVKSSATSFWSEMFPVDELTNSAFGG